MITEGGSNIADGAVTGVGEGMMNSLDVVNRRPSTNGFVGWAVNIMDDALHERGLHTL